MREKFLTSQRTAGAERQQVAELKARLEQVKAEADSRVRAVRTETEILRRSSSESRQEAEAAKAAQRGVEKRLQDTEGKLAAARRERTVAEQRALEALAEETVAEQRALESLAESIGTLEALTEDMGKFLSGHASSARLPKRARSFKEMLSKEKLEREADFARWNTHAGGDARNQATRSRGKSRGARADAQRRADRSQADPGTIS